MDADCNAAAFMQTLCAVEQDRASSMAHAPSKDEVTETQSNGDTRQAWERPVLLRLGASEAELSTAPVPDGPYTYES